MRVLSKSGSYHTDREGSSSTTEAIQTGGTYAGRTVNLKYVRHESIR